MANLTTVEIDQLARRIVELGGNNGVTQRCVPLAAGGLAPDLRVNYEFGLVLGVEEFRQEQLYHLQKDYLHNRALHGYGTVSGLAVGWENADGDIRVTVGAGAGVDQCGRTFLIRNDQCADLRAWLERNRGSLSLAEGPLALYVVGTYDECPDALVAIAGQPCAGSDQALAASRIRDSFNITLRAAPPAMPAWDAIRRLALLMGKVRIVDNLPAGASDEEAITARVAVIDDPLALAALDAAVIEAGGTIPPFWQLPSDNIAETLDRVLMPWVTEVRPRLTPTVIAGCGTADPIETGILLGRLNLTILDAAALTFDFEAAPPATTLDGRPYLLQSQVIQELLFLGSGAAGIAEVREFAVPSRRMEGDTPRIRLWFPFDAPLNLGDAVAESWIIRVRDHTSGQEPAFTVAATPDPHVWFLVPQLPAGRPRAAALRRLIELLDNGLLTIEFNTLAIRVDDGSGGQEALLAAMQRGKYSYVGFDLAEGEPPKITVAYVPEAPAQGGLSEAEVIRIIEEHRQLIPPSVPLADLQFVVTDFQNSATFELWFHLDLDWTRYEARVEDEFTLLVLAETMEDGQPTLIELGKDVQRVNERPNVFIVNVKSDRGPELLQYLRFVFPLAENFVVKSEAISTGTLEEYAKLAGVRFENQYDVANFTEKPAVVLYGRTFMRQIG